MEIRVQHQLHYDYSQRVTLDPHTLYLTPRLYPLQRLIKSSLVITPQPTLLVPNVDAEGNIQHIAYFGQASESLTVEAEMVIDSPAFNAFDFVLFPFEAQRLPFAYPEGDRLLLDRYLDRRDVTDTVEQYARQVASAARWQTVQFLTQLCAGIRENFAYETREEGPAFAPEQTLLDRRGSCRDYATLYIACCRSLGLAARFVSGYLFGNPQQEHELHAWAEVYLPGAGWRGFDPTEGQVVTNQHLALAASFHHDRLPPLSGTFRGQATSSMTASVVINDR